MALIARGQITIRVATDTYSVYQTIDKAPIACDHTGKVLSSLVINSVISVRQGETPVSGFNIGAISTPTGFTSITVNQSTKTVSYTVSGGNSTLADTGTITIPVVVNGQTFTISFSWYKVKAGAPGNPGVDASLLDWVADWNSGKTVIDGQSVITPKIFAGTKNSNGTVTGMAIGRFALSTRNASGTITKETVNGIYGFADGKKTFAVEASGNVQLGNGNEYIKYDVSTGKVEFGSGVSLHWIGATYIDSSGIFTGALSATTVNAIQINASQITAGTIAAARIDVNALKASLITTGNIEALTLNVTKGKIGGWSLDADSIYRGTKNNASGGYTSASGSITIGSTGIRGMKWRLDSTGAGAIAGSNIVWDAAGNVTFSAAVSLLWSNAATTAANNGKLYVRGTGLNHSATRKVMLNGNVVSESNTRGLTLTVIARDTLAVNSTTNYDVYSSDTNCNTLATALNTLGSDKIVILTSYDAIRINATLNTAIQRCGGSDRLITDARIPFAFVGIPGIGKNNGLFSLYGLEATEPYAELSTLVVNGIPQGISVNGRLNTFINGSGIYTGTLTATQVNAVNIDAGSIKSGNLSAERIAAGSLNANKITARTISADRIIAGAITANEIAAKTITSAKIATGTITATEINVSNIQASVVTAGAVNGLTCTFVRGTIAGWTINASQIYKGNVYLGSDGTISNSTKWILRNDGSGQLGNGAITWNAAGAVTFSSAVSLNWTNAATNALNSAKNYADTKKAEAVSAAATDATNKANTAKELAAAMAFGRMIYRDPTFWNGNNSINVYNNSANGTVTISRTADSNAPNDSKQVLLIRNTGTASPYCGGFYFGTATSYRKIFITRIIAKIPLGRNISYHSNAIGNGGSQKWLTPVAGTGDWCEYVCKVSCGTATFSSTHFFAIDGSAGTANASVEWRVAYATVFDVTSTEKYTTTIDANGIYTSTLNANQITAGSISADRIATNSLNGNKITARTISADRIVTGTITANEIAADTITAAKIASRSITADKIKASAITAYEIAGSTITADEIAARTITAAKITSGTITANEINVGSIQTSVVTAGAVNGLTCTFNKGKIGGFTISGTAIYSVNVTPGHNVGIQSDGYIYNCSSSNTSVNYWALNTDGSAIFGTGKIKFGANGDGWLANKNITWDTAGNVSMTGTISATSGKIGNFNISGGKLVNNTTTAAIEFTGLSGSSLYLNTTSSLIAIRSDVNKTGISIQTYSTGARGIYIVANAGSTYSIEAYGPMQLGQRSGERWCVPGVLYVGCKYSAGYNNYYRKIWGDGMTISSFSHIGDGKYRVYHNLGHTDYTVTGMIWASTVYYGYFRLLERTSSYFVIQNVGSSGKPDQSPFDFVVMGRNRW